MTDLVLADDHGFLRVGLEQVLGSLGHRILASVGDGEAALEAVARHDPAMVILDIRMPGMSGIEVLEAMRAAGDTRPVLILAAEIDDAALMAAMRAGVNGILFKDTAMASLQEAIETVLRGERAISMALMERAFELASRPPARRLLDGLSERDRKIVEGAAAGLRNREIAESLSLSEGAVKVYLHRIFDRLEVGNRTELALLVKAELG